MKFSKLMAYMLLLCVLFTVAFVAVAEKADVKPCEHVYEEVVLKKGSCTVKAVIKYECSKCNDIYYESVFQHGELVPGYIEAECGKDQIATETCPLCKVVVNQYPIPGTALDHEKVIKSVVSDECGVGAKKTITYVCKNCKVDPWVEVENLPEKHEYDLKHPLIVKEPTCQHPSGELYYCLNCPHLSVSNSKVEKEKLEDHVPVDDNTEATCIKGGVKDRTICKHCGEVLTEGSETGKDESNHNPEKLQSVATLKPATCTTTGIAKYICLDCGEYVYAIIKDGHKYGEGVVVKEATCGAAGKMEYTCTVCGEGKKTETIKATGEHASYKVGYKDNGCKKQLLYGEYCEVCGKKKPGTEEGKVYEADGVTPKMGACKLELVKDSYKEATCGVAGSYSEVCTVCENVYTHEIPALEHEYDVVLCEATCKIKEGWYEVCKNCGAIGDTISVIGKNLAPCDYETIVEKAPTCEEKGYSKDYCKVCKTVKAGSYKELPAAHKEKVTVLKAATCTTSGLGKFTCEAKDCPVKDLGYKVIPAGHKFGEAVVTTPATHTADGVKTATCTVCGETKTEVIPADATNCKKDDEVHLEATCERDEQFGLGCAVCNKIKSNRVVLEGTKLYHNPSKIYKVITEPTCDAEGKADIYCDMCGKDIKNAKLAPLGHKYGEEVVLPADCDDNERIVKICEVCENELPIGDVENGEKATGHNYKKTNKDSTCTAIGYTGLYVCTDCDHKKSEPTVDQIIPVDPTKHVYKLQKTLKPATCTENGVGFYVCVECEDDKYDIIKAAHTPDEGTVVKEANCGVKGEKVFACKVCGEKLDDLTETIKATGKHNYVDKIIPATCTDDEKAGYFCDVCGKEKNPGTAVVIPDTKLGHDWDKTVITPATCKEEGKGSRVCLRCKLTEEEFVIEKLDHVEIQGDVYEATCEHPVAYKITCANCDYVGWKALPGSNNVALSHKWGGWVTHPATCIRGAYKTRSCTVCGKVLAESALDIVLDANNHVKEFVEIVEEPTCTRAGIAKYIKCTNKECKEYGKFIYETVPASHGDNWSEELVGTGAESILYKKCLVCGAIEIQLKDEDSKCDHNFVKVDAVAATEEKLGATAGIKCDKCGEILEGCEPVAFVPAHTHTEETIPAVAPTCTKEGATEGKICTVCGEVTVAPEVVKKIAHTEEVINHVSPTCAATGLTAGKKCSVCGEILVAQVVVEKLAHTEVAVEAVAPTCAATGLTAGKKCSVCGEVIEAQEVVEKLAHTEEEIAAVEATCTATGLTAGKKCTVCGEITVKQEEVAKLAHTEEEIAAVAATCTEAGLTAGKKCSVCGEITVKQEAVEALGHTEVEIAAVAATCDKAGLTAGKKCSVCDVITVAQEEIPALGHTYTVSWDFNADCTKKVKISTCTVCGHVHTEEMDF